MGITGCVGGCNRTGICSCRTALVGHLLHLVCKTFRAAEACLAYQTDIGTSLEAGRFVQACVASLGGLVYRDWLIWISQCSRYVRRMQPVFSGILSKPLPSPGNALEEPTKLTLHLQSMPCGNSTQESELHIIKNKGA